MIQKTLFIKLVDKTAMTSQSCGMFFIFNICEIILIKLNSLISLTMKKIHLILSLLFAGSFSTAFAQAKREPAKPAVAISDAAGWHKIASTAAELNTDKDAVAIFGADKFKALRVKATKHGIHIKSMNVFYEDGTTNLLDVNSDLKAGETSRDISIDGSKPLKKVSYVYNAVPNKKNEKARLELYGLK